MNIDESSLKTIVAKAIFDGITPEQRNDLLQKAISALLTKPEKGQYGKEEPSPLQKLFEYEIQNLAREHVREAFKTDPNIREMLAGIVTKTIAAISADNSVGEQIGAAIANALSRANSNRY